MNDDNAPPMYTPGMGPHGPTGSPGFGAPIVFLLLDHIEQILLVLLTVLLKQITL